MLILPLLVLTLGAWIYAERRLSFAARIFTGVICFFLLGTNCYFVASVGPGYERKLHRSSIQLIGELIAKGETQRVQQAISTYNGIGATGTTYQAAMQMWQVLNHAPKE